MIKNTVIAMTVTLAMVANISKIEAPGQKNGVDSSGKIVRHYIYNEQSKQFELEAAK